MILKIKKFIIFVFQTIKDQFFYIKLLLYKINKVYYKNSKKKLNMIKNISYNFKFKRLTKTVFLS